MDYNTKSLEPLIRQALALVYSNDKHLIDTQAHERSIVFRFGFYFQNLLLLSNEYKDLHLDIEYNREWEDPKTRENGKKTYPDVVLHKRNTSNHNTLVLEFKGYWNKKGLEEDRKKIHEFIAPNGKYGYLEGYVVLLQEDDFKLDKIFINNQQQSNQSNYK